MKHPNTWANGWRRSAFVFFVALAGLHAAAASSVSTEAVLEPDTLPFHHVARFEVTVTAPEDADIALAPWVEPPPGLLVEVAPAVERTLDGGKKAWTQVWTLSPVASGDFALPETIVLVAGRPVATLESRTLHVRPLTPQEQAAVETPLDWIDLDDLSESRPAPGRGLTVGLMAAGLLLLVALGLYGRRRFRRRVPSPPEAARLALQALEQALGAQTIDPVEFHIRLAAILRDYLAARFRADAPALSTPEIARELLPELPLDAAAAQTLKNVLAACDRVKYARKNPTRARCDQYLHDAHTVLSLLEAPIAPPHDARRGAA